MESASSKPKQERATHEQLEHYVAFYKSNPELGIGKNSPRSPQQIQNLWKQLADELNALRGPTRTPEKWKETLGVWKSQLRTRTRRARMHNRLTGGGPYIKPMGEFEERALATFGLLAIDGVGVGSSGLAPLRETAVDSRTPPSPTQSVAATQPASPEPPLEGLIVSSPTPTSAVMPMDSEIENGTVLEGAPARMSRGDRNRLVNTLIENMGKKNLYEEQRQRREEEQRVEHRETMQAIQALTSVVAELVKVLKPP